MRERTLRMKRVSRRMKVDEGCRWIATIYMTNRLDIRTFGDVQLLIDGAPVNELASQKVTALLIYLAVTRYTHPRNVLAEFLWAYRTPEQALANLRVVISSLRKKLAPYVTINRKTLSINSDSNLHLDAHHLQTTFDAMSGKSSALSAEDIQKITEVMTLYRGTFLDALTIDASPEYDTWVTVQQSKYEDMAITLLDNLINHYLVVAKYADGIEQAQKLLTIRPLREESVRSLMTLYALQGDRDRALQQFQTYRQQLLIDMRVQPTETLIDLRDAIREGNLDTLKAVTLKSTNTPISIASPSLPELDVTAPATSAVLLRHADDLAEKPRKFIGRGGLLTETQALLDNGESVLLHGFGGIGKTALASQVAASRISNEYPGLWLRAGNADYPTLLEALVRPLDAVQTINKLEDEAQIAALRQVLRKANIRLIVLDDVWNGETLYYIVRALPNGLPLLVTARQRYALDAIIDVNALTADEALELLTYSARLTDDTQRDMATQLCKLLGNHTFAVEVAGKTMKARQWSAAQLIERIGHAPQELTTPANFSASERRSVSDLIEVSYQALEERERLGFLAFGSLFTPVVTVDLLALCLDQSIVDTEESLNTLYDNGLLNRTPSEHQGTRFYRMHDLAYNYARANRRLSAGTVIAACQSFAKDNATDARVLEDEIGNLLGAAQGALDAGDTATFIDLIKTLIIDGYMDSRGSGSRLLSLLDKAITLATQQDRQYQEILHYLLGKRGNAERDRGDLKRAQHFYQRAIDVAVKLNLHHRQVIGLCAVSSIQTDTQQCVESLASLERAMVVIRSQEVIDSYPSEDLTYLECHILDERGHYHLECDHDYEKARDAYQKELNLSRKLDNSMIRFFAVHNLSETMKKLGQYDEAIQYAYEALEEARANDNYIWQAYAYQSLAEMHHDLNDFIQAQSYFNEALALYKESGIVASVGEVVDIMTQHPVYTIPPAILEFIKSSR